MASKLFEIYVSDAWRSMDANARRIVHCGILRELASEEEKQLALERYRDSMRCRCQCHSLGAHEHI